MDRPHVVYRRVLRREMHSSRSGAAVVFAAVVSLALLALIGCAAWAAFDPGFRERASAWLADGIAGLDAQSTLTAVGVILLLIGIMLVLAAVLPGRRARHARATERFALVADDGVLADAAADAVSRECALGRRQVSTTMARRSLAVHVTPISGILVDRERAARAASEALAGAGFDAAVKVDIARDGVIA